MPQIPHPNLTIDSINRQLQSLKIGDDLNSDSTKILFDAVKKLSIEVLKVENQTTWYTTHLAGYTTICVFLLTVIITLLLAINWVTVFRPMSQRISRIEQIVENDLKKEFDEKLRNLKTEIESSYADIELNALRGHTWSLHALSREAFDKKNYSRSLLYKLRELRIAAQNFEFDKNKQRFTNMFTEALTLVQIHGVHISNYNHREDEINEIGTDLKATNKEEVIDFWYTFKRDFFKSINEPNTAVEASRSDSKIPSTDSEHQ